MEGFDKTSNHFFAFTNFSAGPICTAAGREAQFEHFTLREHFLILTAMKKSEGDDRVVIRFHEAEGFETQARLRLPTPIKQVWITSLIEEDQETLRRTPERSLDLKVTPWEIVTLKVAV